jgi:hypothetical protein
MSPLLCTPWEQIGISYSERRKWIKWRGAPPNDYSERPGTPFPQVASNHDSSHGADCCVEVQIDHSTRIKDQEFHYKIGSGCPAASPAGLATITGEVFAKFNVARNSNNRIGVEFHAEG